MQETSDQFFRRRSLCQGNIGTYKRMISEHRNTNQEKINLESQLRQKRNEHRGHSQKLHQLLRAIQKNVQDGVACIVGRSPKVCISFAISLANQEARQRQELSDLQQEIRFMEGKLRSLAGQIGRTRDNINQMEAILANNTCRDFGSY